MKTRTLRLTIHAYDTDWWSVAAVEDTYVNGQLRNSELVRCDQFRQGDVLEEVVDLARRMMALEMGRVIMETLEAPGLATGAS